MIVLPTALDLPAVASAVPDSGCRPAYLRVDDYLETLVGARALASGFELGLIDALIPGGCERRVLTGTLGLSDRSLALLTGLLCATGVLGAVGPGVGEAEAVALTPGFRAALAFRDLIETKLAFCALLLPDLAEGFTRLLADPQGFMASSRVFELFRYDLCVEPTPVNLAHTRRWMHFTTVLTRYEAPVCLDHYDCGGHRRVLDIGGNSGEFMRQLCRRHAQVRATVFDLPVVCRIGAEHLADTPEAARVAFVPGDARRDALPAGHDLICFKSMLHDWPDADARALLARATQVLTPGGTLLIFERGPLEWAGRLPGYAQIPLLLFAGFYRSPMFYAQALEGLGLTAIDLVRVELDQPFFLITARKPQ